MPKARIFVASSTEHLALARAIQRNLSPYATVTLWPRIFEPSRYTLESLERALPGLDAGVFVLAPDDIAVIRKRQHQIARDNVIFELGLFIGAIGRTRSFLLVPRDTARLHLPTDLLGLTALRYDPSRARHWTSALAPACIQIREALADHDVPFHGGARVDEFGTFGDFTASFDRLLQSARRITLHFIHSRRWREAHLDAIRAALARARTVTPSISPTRAITSSPRCLHAISMMAYLFPHSSAMHVLLR